MTTSEFRLGLKDYREAVDAVAPLSVVGCAVGAGLLIGLAVGLVGVLWAPHGSPLFRWMKHLLLLLWLGGVVFAIVRQHARYVRPWNRHPQNRRPQVVTADDDGVTFSSNTGAEAWPWAHVRQVASTPRVFALLLDGGQLRMISKAAFGSLEEQGRFADECAARVRVPNAFPIAPASGGRHAAT